MKRYVLDARAATDHFPGIGRYVSNLARAMAGQLAAGEQLLLMIDPRQPSRWQLPPESEAVQRRAVPLSPFNLKQQWLLPRLLRRWRATLYHSPYYLMPYRPGLPTVVTLYDLIPRLFPQTVSRRARLWNGLATRLAMRSAMRVIAISQATRRDLLAAYNLPEEKVKAVPLAPDPRFRPPSSKELDRVRERYGLDSPFVLYLGINKPHKNLLLLLETWRWLLDEGTAGSPPLVIAGAWDARYPEAKHRVRSLGLEERVRFLGPVAEADLPGLYGTATLFVFPSLYEGFGLPVIEAMACGTAVACADSSSLPEVAGDAALLFDPTSPQAIGRVVARLLRDDSLRAALAEKGLAQAASFSWERSAAETLAVYREATKESSRH